MSFPTIILTCLSSPVKINLSHMDIAEVHGWRAYSLKLCERVGGLTFAGQHGKHLHETLSSAAMCRGYNFAAASWTDEEPQEHSDWEIPFIPCSCFVAGTKILMQDLHWKSIETIEIGDKLIGFNREALLSPTRAKRRIQATTVTKTFNRIAETIRLKTSTSELILTPDHKVLVRLNQSHNHLWKQAKDLLIGEEIIRPFSPWSDRHEYDAGWLSGIYDGEGTVDTGGGVRLTTGRLVIAQKPGVTHDRILDTLDKFGFDYSDRIEPKSGVARTRLQGGVGEFFRFAGSIRPVRLLERIATENVFGALQGNGSGVVKEIYSGKREQVYNIQTDSGAYFAEGFGVSNCGFYGYTKLPSMTNVYLAHVTALGRTILHQHGWRSSKYRLDYFIEPFFSTVTLGTASFSAIETLHEVVNYFKRPVPILPFGDVATCKTCTSEALKLQKTDAEPTILGDPLLEVLSIPAALLAPTTT